MTSQESNPEDKENNPESQTSQTDAKPLEVVLPEPSAPSQSSSSSSPGQQDTAEATIPSHMDLQQHHVSKILDEVLDQPVPDKPASLKHPIWLDLGLAIGLLVAMAGFSVGMFKMYLHHTAQQSITQRNYKAAIALLKGAPLPGLFVIPGANPDELLSQALYLDAMDKLDANDVEGALKELQQIPPGFKEFTSAQQIIEEHTEPSATLLQGGTSETVTITGEPQVAPKSTPEQDEENEQ